MPLGDLGRAMRSDFPVVGRPHSYGLPTIYRSVGSQTDIKQDTETQH